MRNASFSFRDERAPVKDSSLSVKDSVAPRTPPPLSIPLMALAVKLGLLLSHGLNFRLKEEVFGANRQ